MIGVNYKELFDEIDKLSEEYISVWEDVCNIESPTDFKQGVDAVGKYFIKMAQKRGWKVEVLPQEKVGDVVCITMNPDAEARPISLSGHIDTVHPVGSYGSPAVKIDGDIMYGPGVTDCKGGVVAGMLAMDALDRCGFAARPVRMLLQTDEEKGSKPSKMATINYICEKAKDAVAFLNLEGCSENEACLVRKGIVSFTFEITGIEAHASKCASKGANAIADAAHKIIELEKLKDEDGITCNCGVISGGTVANTVPGKCIFKANIRYATKAQLEWVKEHMQKVADMVHVPGCTCEAKLTGSRAAMEYCERNMELLNKMNEIYAEAGLPELVMSKRTGGSDAAYVTEAGIACVDSIGIEGGNIHTPDEYAEISSLARSAKRVAAVVWGM